MGNAPTRYISNSEAAVVLGGTERWNELRSNLERAAGKYIDFNQFCELIWRRYERIVSLVYMNGILYLILSGTRPSCILPAEVALRESVPCLRCGHQQASRSRRIPVILRRPGGSKLHYEL